ncbi:hypothetical protein K7I13_03215 [Brucepastera parasyntrophica]|uniref:hypothetical protein n=1 Tax=Brucepastera parasyntrophica TaxID=2880008 RepID=UPI00210DDA5D|nr:hypothetical protein [Brucepastera parasyntrophica]ULQ60332.1 hypothetical protein K7I13_03215 [Brucepastera parasyntrophica]
MFMDDISFERRARFLRNNVREWKGNIFRDKNGSELTEELAGGLRDIRRLVTRIYDDYDFYSNGNDLKSFHNISYTVRFLYSAAACGVSVERDGQMVLLCDKMEFKGIYKKQNMLPFEALQRYGITVRYLKTGKEVPSYKNCSQFEINFGNSGSAVQALILLAEKFSSVDEKKEYGDAITMFAKADYDRLVSGEPAFRECIDPLREDILNSAAGKRDLYCLLAEKLLKTADVTSCYYQRYACPFWNINFMQNKKLICKTMLFDDYLQVHVPFSFAKAEELVRNKNRYPSAIKTAIEHFDCISCGKCSASSHDNIRIIEGVRLCTKRTDARTIYMELRAPDEAECIAALAGNS